MLARLEQNAALLSSAALRAASHVLLVLPKTDDLRALPAGTLREAFSAALKRRRKKPGDLAGSPVAVDLPDGTLAVAVMLDGAKPAFELLTALRKGIQTLLAESPETVSIGVWGDAAFRRHAAELAVYCAWVNGVRLPERKKKQDAKPLARIRLFGYRTADGFAGKRAEALGNILCRELTVLPPNELTPGA